MRGYDVRRSSTGLLWVAERVPPPSFWLPEGWQDEPTTTSYYEVSIPHDPHREPWLGRLLIRTSLTNPNAQMLDPVKIERLELSLGEAIVAGGKLGVAAEDIKAGGFGAVFIGAAPSASVPNAFGTWTPEDVATVTDEIRSLPETPAAG